MVAKRKICWDSSYSLFQFVLCSAVFAACFLVAPITSTQAAVDKSTLIEHFERVFFHDENMQLFKWGHTDDARVYLLGDEEAVEIAKGYLDFVSKVTGIELEASNKRVNAIIFYTHDLYREIFTNGLVLFQEQRQVTVLSDLNKATLCRSLVFLGNGKRRL